MAETPANAPTKVVSALHSKEQYQIAGAKEEQSKPTAIPPVGALFYTGDPSPISGIFRCTQCERERLTHIHGYGEITLEVDAAFPPDTKHGRTTWKLLKYARISPAPTSQ